MLILFFQIVLCIASCAFSAPIDDTADVAAAKATFQAAFTAAEKGEHAALAPAPVAESYLADAPDVAFVKANFKAEFDAIDAALKPVPIVAYNSIYPYVQAAYQAPVVYNTAPVVYSSAPVVSETVVSAPAYFPGKIPGLKFTKSPDFTRVDEFFIEK